MRGRCCSAQYSLFDGLCRKHMIARLRAAGGKGRCSANAPCIPARLGALPPVPRFCFYTCFSATLKRHPWRCTVARRHRVGGIVVSSSRRPAAVMLGSVQIHISHIRSSLGLYSFKSKKLCSSACLQAVSKLL